MPATLEAFRSHAQTNFVHTARKLSAEDYRDAFMFGTNSNRLHQGTFEQVEEKLREVWDDLLGPSDLEWSDVRHVVSRAYSMGN